MHTSTFSRPTQKYIDFPKVTRVTYCSTPHAAISGSATIASSSTEQGQPQPLPFVRRILGALGIALRSPLPIAFMLFDLRACIFLSSFDVPIVPHPFYSDGNTVTRWRQWGKLSRFQVQVKQVSYCAIEVSTQSRNGAFFKTVKVAFDPRLNRVSGQPRFLSNNRSGQKASVALRRLLGLFLCNQFVYPSSHPIHLAYPFPDNSVHTFCCQLDCYKNKLIDKYSYLAYT